MTTVDERAIPCESINIGNNIQIVVRSKDSLIEISEMLHAPILKSKNSCAVIGGGASYIYDEA